MPPIIDISSNGTTDSCDFVTVDDTVEVRKIASVTGKSQGKNDSAVKMSGPKERTRSMKKEKMAEEEASKRKERRSMSGSRDPKLFTGSHDNTIISSDDDEQPSAKVSKPAGKATANYRQALTAKYHLKVEANKKKREEAGLRSQRDDDLEVKEVDLPVDRPTAPLPRSGQARRRTHFQIERSSSRIGAIGDTR